MEFKEERVKEFTVVGISVRVNQKTAGELIGGLWQRWFMEDLEAKIPNKVSNDKYNIYTNYEGDQTKPYTCFLGCRVSSTDKIPDKMQALEIKGGKYAVFDVHGKIPDVVLNAWKKIYKLNEIERLFSADFDVYGDEAANPDDAKLKTYVAIK